MTLSPAQLGFVRALGVTVLMAVLSFLGNQANLSGIVDATLATLISAVALAVEHTMEAKTGSAMFGAVVVRK